MPVEKRPDLHHSQPVHLQEILEGLTPEQRAEVERKNADERAAEEQRASDKRVQDGTRENWQQRLTLAIEKKLTEQMKLTDQLVREMAAYRRLVEGNEKESQTASALKKMLAHVEEIKENSRLTEGVFAAICDARDIQRETRDYIAENIRQSAHFQDFMLDALRAIQENTSATANGIAVLVAKFSNGHAPDGDLT